MADVSPEGVARARAALGIPPERLPRSVAIIMDGNGRWARARGLERFAGHEAGAQTVRDIVTEAAALGLEALTLYSFSTENWSRPRDEVNALMHLYAHCLLGERDRVMKHNIRMHHIGRRQGLPPQVIEPLDGALAMAAGNTGMHLSLALNYGSRAEILDAVRAIARDARDGRLDPDAVAEDDIDSRLGTAGIPDPDLLIRTSGEMRLSNFLLWQISYAELYVADVYWPDFTAEEFHKALRAFADRHRRFGGVDTSNR